MSLGGTGPRGNPGASDQAGASAPGGGATSGKIVRTGAVVPADATDTNLAPLGPGVIQQLTPGDSILTVLAMSRFAVPYGGTDGRLVQALDKLGLWDGPSPGTGYLNALGINEGAAVPFLSANYGTAGIQAALDLYSPVAGRLSVVNIQSWGNGGQLWWTVGVRGASDEWLPFMWVQGDDGIGQHEGHLIGQANQAGTVAAASWNNRRNCIDLYAGTLNNSGGAAFPGGLAVGVGFHGAKNGVYDPDAGGPHIEFAPSGAAPSQHSVPGVNGTARLKFDGTDTIRRLLLSNYSNPYGIVATTAEITADWPIANMRYFAVDFDGGNDLNVGWSDVSQAAAGAAAVKTLAKLAQILPREGLGRKARVAIKARAAGASYGEALDPLLNGLQGYSSIAFVGTATNATAGAVAFNGDVNDLTYAGAIPVPGTNVAGYNPTAGATTFVLPLQLAGGGAAGLAAEPAAPAGWRIRFDLTTATVALRGKTYGIAKVAAGGGQIETWQPMAAAPAVGDLFYIEKPGVLVTGATFAMGAFPTAGPSIVGIDCTVGWSVRDTRATIVFCGCANTLQWLSGTPTFANNYVDPQLGTVTVGMSFRATLGIIIQSANAASTSFLWSQTTTSLTGNTQTSWTSSAAGTGLSVSGGAHVGAPDQSTLTGGVIGTSSVVGTRASRILASGAAAGLLLQTSCGVKAIEFSGNVRPCIKINGLGLRVNFDGCTDAGGNTDVGLDLTTAQSCEVMIPFLTTAPGDSHWSVTGTAGDIRLTVCKVATQTGIIVPMGTYTFMPGMSDLVGNRVWGGQNGNNGTPRPAGYTPSMMLVKAIGAVSQWDLAQLLTDGAGAPSVQRAQADTAAHAAGPIVVVVAAAAIGIWTLAAPAGSGFPVLWDSSVGSPDIGKPAYLSVGTPGQATVTVPPVAATNQKRRIGWYAGGTINAAGTLLAQPEIVATLADGNP